MALHPNAAAKVFASKTGQKTLVDLVLSIPGAQATYSLSLGPFNSALTYPINLPVDYELIRLTQISQN